MSTESSTNETTPLRRKVSEDIVDDALAVSTAKIIHEIPINNNYYKNATQRQFVNDDNNANNIIVTNGAAVTKTRVKKKTRATNTPRNQENPSVNNSTAVQLEEVDNKTTHNNLEVRSNRTNCNNNGGDTSDPEIIEMDTNKRILCRIAIDVFILLCVGFPILIFYIWGDPYKRGFFCDDESLQHPFKESTVTSWMLYIIGGLVPLIVVLTVEIVRSKHSARKSNAPTRRYVFMEYEIPDWLVECYKKAGVFAFGAAVCQLATDIAKYSIGRLRPHFFKVCQPVLRDGSVCTDAQNIGKYIEDFTCRGIGSTARMLKEVRLSFPSGHSSFTFFTMVYLAIYLQSRMTWHGSKLLRHFLQFIFIMTAWYTALSRVSDYKHHWSDVLAGTGIGALSAVVVSYTVPDKWFNWNTVWPNEHEKGY